MGRNNKYAKRIYSYKRTIQVVMMEIPGHESLSKKAAGAPLTNTILKAMNRKLMGPSSTI